MTISQHATIPSEVFCVLFVFFYLGCMTKQKCAGDTAQYFFTNSLHHFFSLSKVHHFD